MKCENCGSNFLSKDLKCPYCGTVNQKGLRWYHRRKEMMERNAEELEEEKRRNIPYVINLMLNISLVVVFLAVFVLAVVRVNVEPSGDDIEQMKAHVDALYRDREYGELYKYLEENDLRDTVEKYYVQAADLFDRYDSFIKYRMELEETKPSEWDLTTLRLILIYSGDLVDNRTFYSENSELYKFYGLRVRAYWRGTLRLTNEEITRLSGSKILSYDETTEPANDNIRRLSEN